MPRSHARASASGIQASAGLEARTLTQADADTIADFLGENVVNEIYMYVLHSRLASEEDLVHSGFPPPAIAPALAVLVARGLISPADDGGWVAVPPSRSLPSLAAKLEERARLVRTSLPGLTSAYRAPEGDVEPGRLRGIEFLPSAREVAFAITQCFTDRDGHVRIMRRDSIASRKATFEAMPSLKEGQVGTAPRVIRCVTVLHTDLVHHLTSSDLEWFDKAPREELLLSGHVPFTAVVGGPGLAVVEFARELDDGEEDVYGFLVTNRDVVQAISAVLDLVVETSTPWRRTDVEGPPPQELSQDEREILHLLTLGIPDPTIARRLGISTRTFDRRLRALLDKLGAATRFQAGVIASRRGWL